MVLLEGHSIVLGTDEIKFKKKIYLNFMASESSLRL